MLPRLTFLNAKKKKGKSVETHDDDDDDAEGIVFLKKKKALQARSNVVYNGLVASNGLRQCLKRTAEKFTKKRGTDVDMPHQTPALNSGIDSAVADIEKIIKSTGDMVKTDLPTNEAAIKQAEESK